MSSPKQLNWLVSNKLVSKASLGDVNSKMFIWGNHALL